VSNSDPSPRTTQTHLERRLAAILHADVKGYSRLIGEDDVATLRTLTPYFEMMSALVRQHGGRVAGSAGDSLLAEFPSVVEAAQCAVEMQQELKVKNAELPPDRKVEFRMGINLGDIVVEGEQIHGDGINIAVRLEGLAEAGGICVSQTVYDQIKHRLTLRYEDLGEHMLKNIAEPVRVWRVMLEVPSPLVGEGQGEGAAKEAGSSKFKVQSSKSKGQEIKPRRLGTAHRFWVVAAVAGLLLIVGAVAIIQYLSRPILSPQPSVLKPHQRLFPSPTNPPLSCCPSSTSVVIPSKSILVTA
jgi:class 3 adenylate cyclase